MPITFQLLGILLVATPLASREVRGRTMLARRAPRGTSESCCIIMIAFQEWERLQAAIAGANPLLNAWGGAKASGPGERRGEDLLPLSAQVECEKLRTC